MRIAFYAPLKSPDHPVPSGDRRMARLLIQALRLAGHDVTLASGFRAYEGKGDKAAQDLIYRHAEEELKRLKSTVQADLWFTYHLYHKAPDLFGPEISQSLKIPYWVCEASFAPKQAGGPWDKGHDLVEQALHQADRVFELNPTDRGYVAPLLKPSGILIDLKPFLESAPYRQVRAIRGIKRAELAREYDLNPDHVWLVCAAMMRPGDKMKSFELLAKSLGDLPENEWSLIVIGDGKAREDVETAFADLDDIAFVGEQPSDRIPEFLTACDLYVWPGVNEAFGLSVLEAQAAGLPVISAKRAGISNMVANGKSGLLVPEGDADAFTMALEQLIQDRDLRLAMGADALKNTQSNHDISVAARIFRQETLR